MRPEEDTHCAGLPCAGDALHLPALLPQSSLTASPSRQGGRGGECGPPPTEVRALKYRDSGHKFMVEPALVLPTSSCPWLGPSFPSRGPGSSPSRAS